MAQAIVYDKDAALRQGIVGAGSAFAQALSTMGERRQAEEEKRKEKFQKEADAKKYGSILQQTIGQLPDDASGMQVFKAYSDAINQGLPPEIAQSMGTLQKTLQKSPSGGLGFDSRDDLVDLLGRFGMGDEQAQREADLYLALPTGGRTQYANFLFDRMQRGQLGSNVQPQIQGNQAGMNIPGGPSVDVSDVEEVEVEGFQFPELDLFQGLNSKEKVDRQKELFNTNAKFYAENNQKVRGYDDEMRRLGQMSRLNNSGKLPEGMQRLNINWTTGDIRVPALANPETQLFVKSVNDFTTKAKDTYGARVTNFELGTFMRRLPTLANTEQGRRLILEQMEVNAAIEKLYHDSLKEVYDHYGLRGIDSQQAENLAAELRKDDEQALLKRNEEVLEAQEVYEVRQNAPEGMLPVKNPQGNVGYLPVNKIDAAQKKGWKVL